MKLVTSILAIASAMVLSNCKHTTVADHVPAACGTETGDIPVDWLTSVSTVSRIAPVGSGCVAKRNSAEPQPRRKFATTPEGMLISTHRMAPVEGYHHAASGTGDLLGGAGSAMFGGAALKGKFRSRINNTNNLHLGGCTDPNSPYIYGY